MPVAALVQDFARRSAVNKAEHRHVGVQKHACLIFEAAVAGGISALGGDEPALVDRVGDDAAHEGAGADRIVVTGNDEVDDVGIAVGVDDGDHRDLQLVGLDDTDVLLLGVDDEHGVGELGHGADPAQVALQLMHLDLAVPNFGIQEWSEPNERLQEVFTGYPELKDGYAYANEKPGWGVEINEKAAAKYPFGSERGERKALNGGWGVVRRPDGTVINQ